MKIKILENGPYLVSGGIPLYEMTIDADEEGNICQWHIDHKFPLKENYILCRCGKSKNKPFCDGTHSKTDFIGTEVASKIPYLDRAVELQSKNLKLTDVWDLCDHSRFCLRKGGIRELLKSDNPEDLETAMEEAKNCPSGRLVLWDNETGKPMEPVLEKSIAVVDDPQKHSEGPLWVRGGIQIESADGTVYEVRNRVTLCRCGESDNKPLCDGSHWMTAQEKEEFRKKWKG
jgi:CDGSH-type Zn-finger protein